MISIIDPLSIDEIIELIDAYFIVFPQSLIYIYSYDQPHIEYIGFIEESKNQSVRKWVKRREIVFEWHTINELTDEKFMTVLSKINPKYLYIKGPIRSNEGIIYMPRNIVGNVVEKEIINEMSGITRNVLVYFDGSINRITYTRKVVEGKNSKDLLTGEDIHFTPDGQIIWRRFWTEGKLDGIEEKYFFLNKLKEQYDKKNEGTNIKDTNIKDTNIKGTNIKDTNIDSRTILTPAITNYWIAGVKVTPEQYEQRKKFIGESTQIITDLSNIIGQYL
jgi:hypothetical protein